MKEPLNNPDCDMARRRRSNVWIDRNFQTRYAVFMSGTAAIVIVILGILYAGVLAEQHELVGINAISAGVDISAEDAEFDSTMNDMMRSEDGIRLVVLFVSAGVLIIVLAWASVRMTFRVVGPVQAASNMLRKIRAGDDSGIRRFRKGDEFSFLADDIIDLRDSIREKEEATAKLLLRSVAEVERLGGDPQLAAEIRACVASRKSESEKTGQEG